MLNNNVQCCQQTRTNVWYTATNINFRGNDFPRCWHGFCLSAGIGSALNLSSQITEKRQGVNMNALNTQAVKWQDGQVPMAGMYIQPKIYFEPKKVEVKDQAGTVTGSY